MMILVQKREVKDWHVQCKYNNLYRNEIILFIQIFSIIGHYRRKVVAKDWYANGDELKVSGKVEITQQSEYDISNIEVQFKGLEENSGYHIHMVCIIVVRIIEFY